MNKEVKEIKKDETVSAKQSSESIESTLAALMAQVGQLAKDLAEMKKPQVAPVDMAIHAAKPALPGFDNVKGYKKINRGYPVQPGQTWHDLTPAQRKQWFVNHENRWKRKYTERAQNMGGGEMNWTRG